MTAAYAEPGRVLALMMSPALAHGITPGRVPIGVVATGGGGGNQAGQRGDPDGDAAVAGQRLVHEVEAVGHLLAAGSDRQYARRPGPAARTVHARSDAETRRSPPRGEQSR